MKRILLVLAGLLLCAPLVRAQSALPTPTPPASNLTMTCPAPATGSEIWRCTGNSSTCTVTSANWNQIGTITGASGNYADSTGTIGQIYGYAGVCTDGAIIAATSNLYFGTPTAPLAAGTLSGSTT